MPQVLTRRTRRKPIALLTKRGHLYLQTQKLALVAITQEAVRSPQSQCSISLSSHWVQLHAEQLHPPPRLILSRSGYSCTLRNCTHRLVSHLTRTRLLQCGATPKRQRSRDDWTLPAPINQPPPSIHLVSAATRHRLSSLLPGASPHASEYAALLRRLTLRLRATLYRYIYTSLLVLVVAKIVPVLFCVAYALVCAGRAVLYVHARRP